MQRFIQEAFHKKNWAVLGATQTQKKFGYKIFKRLCDKGYNTTPINPNYTEVDGITAASTVSETKDIDVINVVVAPEIALQALDCISENGIEYIWFQPGAYDDLVIQKANDLGLKVIYGYCVLVELDSIAHCPID